MNEHDSTSKQPNVTEGPASDRREFLTAVTAAVATGTAGGFATGAQAAESTFQATPMTTMAGPGTIALSEVGVSEMPVRGNMALKVTPATAALLKNLSRSISQTINASPGASADHVQYSYSKSVAGSQEELVVR